MTTLKVTGMTCGHCENAVKKALEGVSGVERVVSVSAQTGQAVVEGEAEASALIASVKAEGYEAEVAG
jgi:copper chaperone